MSGMMLIVRDKPPFATIQDSGRQGYMRWGVSVSGAMDVEALASANILVGNEWHEAAIEFAMSGGEWETRARSSRIAVTGGRFRVFVDGVEKTPYASLVLRRGQRLLITGTPDAVWGYIAIQGGFSLPDVLGSRSTLVRAKLGGFEGRALETGDELPLRMDQVGHMVAREIRPPIRQRSQHIRVLLGPQDDHFSLGTVRNFITEDWTVTNRMDRMGYHLHGPRLMHGPKGANIVSDGINVGGIQVPASGQPIALMRDCQPTGGYPKIATVLTPDLGAMAQMRPGATLRFMAVDQESAQVIRRDFAHRLGNLGRIATPQHIHFIRKNGPISDLIDATAG